MHFAPMYKSVKFYEYFTFRSKGIFLFQSCMSVEIWQYDFVDKFLTYKWNSNGCLLRKWLVIQNLVSWYSFWIVMNNNSIGKTLQNRICSTKSKFLSIFRFLHFSLKIRLWIVWYLTNLEIRGEISPQCFIWIWESWWILSLILWRR